jgi:hypothetical protein
MGYHLPKDLAMRLLPALSVTAECHPKFRKLARYKCSEPHLISYKHRLWVQSKDKVMQINADSAHDNK